MLLSLICLRPKKTAERATTAAGHNVAKRAIRNLVSTAVA